MTRPATTSHAGLSPEHRRLLGVSDSLVRISIGLEAADDLLEDIGRALSDD
jgi:cystathionine beta-lyase/cystathionine gamma-synthase